jgi:predicted flavoprotein YhiN
MKDVKKLKISVIGGGASSLLLAALLKPTKFEISIFEKNSALGRKFLVAGDGGFNLTHSEEIKEFVNRYHPSKFIAPSIKKFSNEDFRNYLKSIGIETYVGSSKRVFPLKEIKPIQVLNAFETELKKNNVQLFFKHTWKGFDKEGNLLFDNNGIF